MPETSEYASQLNAYISRYVEIKKKTEDKRKELSGLKHRRDALLDLLVYLRGQASPSSEGGEEDAFPLILGKAHSKFTVLSTGILPPEECFSFYNSNYIYPVGYKIKRKYSAPIRANPKLLYHCQIRDLNGECIFEIRSSSGQVWSGEKEKVWAEFSSSFEKMGFPDIESFFGLNHETVQRIIEDLGDISALSSYLPLKTRSRKGRKSRKEEQE